VCGRYTLTAGHEALARTFLAEFREELKASWTHRYNITPGSGILAIYEDRDKGGRHADIFHWGLVPHWAKDPDVGARMINARVETVSSKPAYREPFRYRRCLVPMSGFYEWDRTVSPRQPYYFYPGRGSVMAIAGLWEHWLHPTGSEILSIALVTCPAIGAVGKIHHRMPVVLMPEDWDAWLDCEDTRAHGLTFRRELVPEGFLRAYPVSLLVNNAGSEGPDLIEPLEEPPARNFQMDLFED